MAIAEISPLYGRDPHVKPQSHVCMWQSTIVASPFSIVVVVGFKGMKCGCFALQCGDNVPLL